MSNSFQPQKSQTTGYTLIELTVAISIFLIISVLGANFITTGFQATTFVSEQETAVAQARRSIEILSKEIRGLNNSNRGDYPISVMEDENLVIYTDTNYDNSFEKVRYYLDGEYLYRVVVPAGPANDYNQPGATTTLANYVNNGDETLFSYYDNDMNETGDIDDVRLIRINLSINVTPERAPNDYLILADVNLRNLKDNL